MKFAISYDSKRRLIIDKVRKKLIQVIGEQESVVKLDGFTTEELNGIIFDYTRFSDGSVKKEFALPLEVLKKIDMSNVSFDNFDAWNVDFSGFTGVRIAPHKLYEKKCFYTVFSGVTFLNEFLNCDIEGCNFSGSKNAVIGLGVDFGEKNVFCDVTFKNPIVNSYLQYCDFAGSKGAVIKVGHGAVESISNCRLKDTTIEGSFDGCQIYGVDFSGAHGEDGGKIKINPNKLRETIYYEGPQILVKDLSDCNFEGVEFTNKFNHSRKFLIKGAKFNGSQGAVINPALVFNRDYRYASFGDVRFNGVTISNAMLDHADFTGSQGAVFFGLQRNMDMANLTDTEVAFEQYDKILTSPGVETATCEGRLFSEVLEEAYVREFEMPVKQYSKKIDRMIAGTKES